MQLKAATSIFFAALVLAAAGPGWPADDAGQEGAAVRQVVRNWADAWRSGNFAEYAAYYLPGFSGKYSSNKQWREARKPRVDGRTDIRLDLGPMLVQFNLDDSSIARVIFLQSYRSASWCDVVEKNLGLKKTELGWRISSEEAKPRNRC